MFECLITCNLKACGCHFTLTFLEYPYRNFTSVKFKTPKTIIKYNFFEKSYFEWK